MGRFLTISSHFFDNYINMFHTTKVQTVILRFLAGDLFKKNDPNRKHFRNYASDNNFETPSITLFNISYVKRNHQIKQDFKNHGNV